MVGAEGEEEDTRGELELDVGGFRGFTLRRLSVRRSSRPSPISTGSWGGVGTPGPAAAVCSCLPPARTLRTVGSLCIGAAAASSGRDI